MTIVVAPEPKVCVVGIWHLGAVTAACLADLGYAVVGVEEDVGKVQNLNKGIPPLFEPDLPEMMAQNIAAGRLTFAARLAEGLAGASYVLITYDTPLDDNEIWVINTPTELYDYKTPDEFRLEWDDPSIGYMWRKK